MLTERHAEGLEPAGENLGEHIGGAGHRGVGAVDHPTGYVGQCYVAERLATSTRGGISP